MGTQSDSNLEGREGRLLLHLSGADQRDRGLLQRETHNAVKDSVDGEAPRSDESALPKGEAERQLRAGIHPRAGGPHEEPHARLDRGREDVGHRQPGMMRVQG